MTAGRAVIGIRSIHHIRPKTQKGTLTRPHDAEGTLRYMSQASCFDKACSASLARCTTIGCADGKTSKLVARQSGATSQLNPPHLNFPDDRLGPSARHAFSRSGSRRTSHHARGRDQSTRRRADRTSAFGLDGARSVGCARRSRHPSSPSSRPGAKIANGFVPDLFPPHRPLAEAVDK